MLKIKLTRIGKKGQPQYRIVIREDRVKQGGKYLAEIGYYNPGKDPLEFKLDQAAYKAWMLKGAQPTSTIRSLAAKLSSSTK